MRFFREYYIANPETDYGESKMLAELCILAKLQGISKRLYNLRPCMIYGRSLSYPIFETQR